MVQEEFTPKHKVMVAKMATYFMTKDSTLRNFSVFRVFDGYYTMVKLECKDDLTVATELSVHDLNEGFGTSLMGIDRNTYDKFMDAYNMNIETMFMKSDQTPEDCPKSRRFKLTNPHWRMKHLFSKRGKDKATVTT